MASKSRSFIVHVSLMVALLATNIILADDNVPIPDDKSQLNKSATTVIKVLQDGSGNFKTINEAIKSIPKGNTKRVIVYNGDGTYNDKIRIEREKPFITLYGALGKMSTLTYGGTALKYGTLDSSTLIVESDYFVASNIIISNTELGVLGDEGMYVLTAHARDKNTDDTGYSFVHCDVTGIGNGTLLGRVWMSKSKVVFDYSNLGVVVNKAAWSNNFHPEYDL
ncbi:hypothetical protein TanjilG_06936 [Lupinus angustifolius]|uniref:pectinesterase n=1 Tax=Lupinus angustifolius TaxID=3871 RepID=A0A1J7IDT3_LUPAN|nr:hypothetical protein TanjilG_06936 [Lupinus angustifolius]